MDSLQQSLRTNNMKTYTFIIGSMDDFENASALMDEVENKGAGDEDPGNGCYSIHEFEAPEGCDEECVTLIGRGIAFSEGWAQDDSISFLVEGALDGPGEQEMFDAGVTARESKKDRAQSEQQQVDPYDIDYRANDPREW
jgi:hypothetical protein